MLSVQALAERYLQFEDKSLATTSLADLGGIVCEYNATLARSVLSQAGELLRASELDGVAFTSARSRVLGVATKCDRDLMRRMVAMDHESLGESRRGELAFSDLTAAGALIKLDPEVAAQMALTTADSVALLTDNQLNSFSMFLWSLGRQSEPASRQVLLRALSQIRAGGTAMQALFALGAYPFSPGGKNIFSQYGVGGSVILYELSGRRPEVSDEIARAYLEAAAPILAAPVTGPEEQTARYALASQLEPHARKLAPEVAELLRSVTEQAYHLPQAITGEAVKRMVDPKRKKVGEPADPRTLGGRWVNVFANYWRQQAYDKAREVASEIEDKGARDQCLRLVAFGEARRMIAEGRVEEAKARVKEMPSGVKRVLLYLGIAAARMREGDPRQAVEFVHIALVDAARTAAVHRPYLRLAAAKVLAGVDESAAVAMLQQAVQGFNEIDFLPMDSDDRRPGRHGVRASDSGFREWFGTERTTIGEPLNVKGVDGFRFATVLPAFEEAEIERVEAIVDGVLSEQRLAEAQARLVELRLKRAFAPTQS